jgi:hypothetical protein
MFSGMNIENNTDTILTILEWHLLIQTVEALFSKNDKDEHKNS